MHPDAVHLLAGAYVVDALDRQERLGFEAHLATCADCRSTVADLREAAAQLAAAVAVPPPTPLRTRVARDISRVRPLPPLPVEPTAPAPAARRLRNRLRDRPRPWAMALAAALLAVLGVGVSTGLDRDPPREVSVSSEVLAAADRKHSTIQSDRGWAATLWHSDSVGRAVLVVRGMPAPPSGLVYQAWLDQPGSELVSAGLLPTSADRTIVLTGDAATARGAAITLEPAGGSTRPTSEPIAVFDFGQGA